MGKSNQLKDSMKGGLNGLLSSTTPTSKEDKPAKVATEKEKKLPYIVTSSSTRVFIPE